jgi:hypothetical protein
MCESPPVQTMLLDKLSGPAAFYCPFCLRHNLHTKNNRNVLILSFRSIIGYFYYQNYIFSYSESQKIWLSELEDFITAHVEAGETNPLFVYDPETLFWFVDFSRVGNSKKKVPLEEVLKTVVNILTCFNFSETIPNLKMSAFYSKYKTAIESFYERRYRPDERKILVPTFAGCGIIDGKNFHLEDTRTFDYSEMQLKRS